MLESPSAPACAALALRCALDRLPSGAPADSDGEYASQVEPLCWQRAQRLAARHFRASHLGVATVVAYSALRRIELNHLRAVTEALARGGDAHVLETRLGLRGTPEVARA